MVYAFGVVVLGLLFALNVGVLGWIVVEAAFQECFRLAACARRTSRRVAVAMVAALARPNDWRATLSVTAAGLAVVVLSMPGLVLGVLAHGQWMAMAPIVFSLEPQEGLRAVRRGDLWGYDDEMGEHVIRTRFSAARSFSEGLAPVSVDHRWGYIDHDGRFVIEPQFRLAGEYQGGKALVGLDDFSLAYIDAQGRLVSLRNPVPYPRAEVSHPERNT